MITALHEGQERRIDHQTPDAVKVAFSVPSIAVHASSSPKVVGFPWRAYHMSVNGQSEAAWRNALMVRNVMVEA